MSILHRNAFSFCAPALPKTADDRLFSKAVCRLPLSAGRGQLFAKPALPTLTQPEPWFGRPPMPLLVRPFRSIGGLNSAQLNRLFDKVIGQGRFL
ncbi:MAG: hypothetical protein ABIZ04_11645 [Opitutus sp.]